MDAEWLLHRFRRQIEQAAKKVVEKWPYLIDVSLDDARQQASLALLEHQRSGQFDRDAARAASPSQLDCFVLAALNGDLHTWAKKIHTDIKRGIEWGVTQALDQEDGFDPTDEVDFRLSWPTLHMRYYGGLTDREIADELGVSLRTVGYRIAREKKDFGRTMGVGGEGERGKLAPSLHVLPRQLRVSSSWAEQGRAA
jgi:hypothetical protein